MLDLESIDGGARTAGDEREYEAQAIAIAALGIA
jgi:hypothetical protein